MGSGDGVSLAWVMGGRVERQSLRRLSTVFARFVIAPIPAFPRCRGEGLDRIVLVMARDGHVREAAKKLTIFIR